MEYELLVCFSWEKWWYLKTGQVKVSLHCLNVLLLTDFLLMKCGEEEGLMVLR